MADYYLRSTLNPSKVVKCTVTVTQTIPKADYTGDPVWIIKAGTPEPHKDTGLDLPPAVTHVTSLANVDEAIRELTRQLAAQIDWGIAVEDYRPPYVYSWIPSSDAATVSLYSNVTIGIKDNLPGHGIDRDTIQVTVNGMDVTNDLRITGNPFDYVIDWVPPLRVAEQEVTPS